MKVIVIYNVRLDKSRLREKIANIKSALKTIKHRFRKRKLIIVPINRFLMKRDLEDFHPLRNERHTNERRTSTNKEVRYECDRKRFRKFD